GKTIVTGGGRRVVRGMLETLGGVVSLWDVATAKELRREELPQVVSGVALSPDGKTFALAQHQRLSPFTENQAVQLWDAATWREVRRAEPFGGNVLQLAFSPDGKTLAGHNQTSNGPWEVAPGRPGPPRPGHGRARQPVGAPPNR